MLLGMCKVRLVVLVSARRVVTDLVPSVRLDVNTARMYVGRNMVVGLVGLVGCCIPLLLGNLLSTRYTRLGDAIPWMMSSVLCISGAGIPLIMATLMVVTWPKLL